MWSMVLVLKGFLADMLGNKSLMSDESMSSTLLQYSALMVSKVHEDEQKPCRLGQMLTGRMDRRWK